MDFAKFSVFGGTIILVFEYVMSFAMVSNRKVSKVSKIVAKMVKMGPA